MAYKKKLKGYAKTLEKNIKDPDVQRSAKEGFVKGVGVATVGRGKVSRKLAGKAKKEWDKLPASKKKAIKGAGAELGKYAASPAAYGAKKAMEAGSGTITIGGKRYKLNRGRYKESGNVGSWSEKKGKRLEKALYGAAAGAAAGKAAYKAYKRSKKKGR